MSLLPCPPQNKSLHNLKDFYVSPHVSDRQGRIQQSCADPLQAGGIAAVVDDVDHKAPQCADDHEAREEHFQNIHDSSLQIHTRPAVETVVKWNHCAVSALTV